MLGKISLISVLVIGLAYFFRSGDKIIRDGKVIKTNTGPVRGSLAVSRDGRDYYSWYGIPYAKPPVGNLRFSDPMPVDKWTEEIDGREEGPECAQADVFGMAAKNVFGSEDCLQLNVFVPKKLHDDTILGKKPKIPVIVYIHGGGYVMGSSRLFSAGYFMDEDVICVSINYRLDILGFLTTGDKIVRGNQGLKDQTLALKWIQNNIEVFGGDPNQVMIFGTSGGAASVHQQTLSPLSKGLFQSGFVQSGAASNSWGFLSLRRSLEKTNKVAKNFNCPTNDNQKLVDCLRKLDVEELVESRLSELKAKVSKWFSLPINLPIFSKTKNEYALNNPHIYGDGFEPIVEAVNDEHAFIAEHPLKITSEGKAHRVPLLIGHATHEGLVSAGAFKRNPKNMETFEAARIPALKSLFGIDTSNADEIADQIYKFYFPEGKMLSLEDKIKRYVDMFGDAFFNFDIREAVRLQRKFSPVYYYVHNNTDIPDITWIFTEITGEWPLMVEVGWYLVKSFVKEKIFGIVPPFNGVNHAADMIFYSPLDLMNMRFTKEDKLYQYSKDLVSLAVQFAKDDTKMEFRGVKIPKNPSEGPLIVAEFKNEEVVISPEPFTERMEFLQSLKIRP